MALPLAFLGGRLAMFAGGVIVGALVKSGASKEFVDNVKTYIEDTSKAFEQDKTKNEALVRKIKAGK